jgi:hypothetical protein
MAFSATACSTSDTIGSEDDPKWAHTSSAAFLLRFKKIVHASVPRASTTARAADWSALDGAVAAAAIATSRA